MTTFAPIPGGFEMRHGHEVARVEAWGPDSARVRVALHRITDEDHGALDVPPPGGDATASFVDGVASLDNGLLRVTACVPPTDGIRALEFAFHRADTGEELLAEQRQHFWWPGAHTLEAAGGGHYRLRQEFRAYPGERLYGLGQHQHGLLDHKGLALDLVQRNCEATIPFVLSSRGYGFLWNLPALGRVEFAENGTRWEADSAPQIDYWVTAASTPAGILGRYADATGHAPDFPDWALGMWQSRLRYTSQAEILSVAREYARRGWPLDVIVTDYFHWTAMGDYRFDRNEYPDPAGLLRELGEMGVRLMVSVWPTVSPMAEDYSRCRSDGLLASTARGVEFHQDIQDKDMPVPMPVAVYDASNPAARDWLWERLSTGYHDLGVRAWWLDACEPELNPTQPEHLDLWAGSGAAISSAYPRDHARGVWEHLAAAEGGAPDDILLVRSAWAGSQRYGAALWSGDIQPTWEAFRAQVRAGLSAGLSGIPWWTTDIGGFHGGDPSDPLYQELMVRWFEWATFCPILRMHGHREPRSGLASGGPNEPWSYGERAAEIMGAHIALRERLRPYLRSAFRAASRTGVPPMRPYFVDFPADGAAWAIEDAYLFGPDLLVAPVLEAGAAGRAVYLPDGADWVNVATGASVASGEIHEVEAPLEGIPVFARAGAEVASLIRV